MSNELVLAGQRPAFSPAVAVPVAAAENPYLAGITGGGINLPFLSFRGKGFRLRKDGEEVSLGTSISVLLVAARPNLSKRYYDKAYVSGADHGPPRCFSSDGKEPDGADPLSPSCSSCPMNVFGTAKRNDGSASKGKACGDYKRIVVYPLIGSGEGAMVQAAIMDLPPTSFRAKKSEPPAFLEFTRVLAENGAMVLSGEHYVGAFSAQLTFTDGEYPRLVWRPDRWATDRELANAKEMAASDDVAEALGAEAVESLEAPPAPTPVAPSVVVQNIEAAEARAAAPPVEADAAAVVAKLRALLGSKA